MGGPAPLAKASGAALLALLLALLLPAGALGFGPLSSFGELGDGPGELAEPAGVAIAGDGTAYVTDQGHDRVVVFDPDGSFRLDFGAGTLDDPRGVVLGPGGYLYIADSGNERVAVYAPDGRFLAGFGEEALGEPVGLAFGEGGLLYVADRGLDRVVAFDADGEPVLEFGEEGSEDGQLQGPTDVAVTPGGTVLVADGENDRVSAFSADGEFLHAFGAVAAPGSIAVDVAGLVYVGESVSNRVSRFDLDGTFLDAFGEGTGTQPGAVNHPTGIAFDCRGAVYVAEQGLDLARVERFGEPGTPLCSAVRTEPLTPLALPQPAPAVTLPDSKFLFGKLVLYRKRGTGTLFVFVPGPGQLVLGGTDLRTARRMAPRRGGLVKMPVTPLGELKRKLRKKGRAKGWVRVSFRPTDGVARTKRRPVLLLKRRG